MLKHVLDSLDQVPEALRGFYAEKDGKFYLQVDGMVPKARLDEFRETNVKLMKANDELKNAFDSLGGITAEEIAELKTKASGKSKEEVDALVNAEVEKRVKKMREDYDAQVGKLAEDVKGRDAQLSRLLIDNELTAAASKLGVRGEAMTDVVLRGRSTFTVENGKPVAKNEKGEIVYGKDGTTPLAVSEWLAERAKDAPHWFQASQGSGARGNAGNGGGGAATQQQDGVRGRSKMAAARASNQNG